MDVLKKITALKARQNLGQVLEEVYYKGDRYIIERAGKPMAAVVPLWQLEAWQQRRVQFFGTVEEVWEQNKDISPDVIKQEVTKVVNAVRTPPSASSPQ